MPEVVQPAEKAAIRSESGTASTYSRWTFCLTNIDEVPREYMMVDVQKVNAAIRQGVREIPGLNIYEEKSIRIR